jgi:hypothetical protein
MKKLVLLVAFFGILRANCQDTLKTHYGRFISPVDTIFCLNVFININYDLCQTCDPYYNKSTPVWQPGQPNTINDSPPIYITNYIDQAYNPDNIHGTLTKHWAEASLYIYDMQGKQLKSIAIPGRENGQVIIYGSELQAGIYNYTLIADGQVVGTEQMILTD